MPSNCCGPLTSVSLQTTFCMACSGLIHGPPLPFQPASLFMLTSSPSRCASLLHVLEQLAPAARS